MCLKAISPRAFANLSFTCTRTLPVSLSQRNSKRTDRVHFFVRQLRQSTPNGRVQDEQPLLICHAFPAFDSLTRNSSFSPAFSCWRVRSPTRAHVQSPFSHCAGCLLAGRLCVARSPFSFVWSFPFFFKLCSPMEPLRLSAVPSCLVLS